MNIFQIEQKLLDIFSEVEELDGELTPELEEQLVITQDEFKNKVKSYSNVIKCTNAEIDLIDDEIARLKALKDSKNKAIARLEKVIINAIEQFGDTNKSVNKYVDFGTGKISIRKSEKVEVDTDRTDTTVKYFFDYIRGLAFTRELNQLDSIDAKEFILSCSLVENGIDITKDEFENIQASLSFDVSLKDLITSKGLDFVRSIFNNVSTYKAKSNVNKTTLKPILKEGTADLSHIARIEENKTISIK